MRHWPKKDLILSNAVVASAIIAKLNIAGRELTALIDGFKLFRTLLPKDGDICMSLLSLEALLASRIRYSTQKILS